MGLQQVQSLQVIVDLEVMAIKGIPQYPDLQNSDIV